MNRTATRLSYRTWSGGRRITEGPLGVGSRYTVLWKIGSVPVGGIAEVVEFDKARDLAWINITGVTQRGRFRLRDAGAGTNHRDIPAFLPLRRRPARPDRRPHRGRQVGRSLSESLKNLQRLVES